MQAGSKAIRTARDIRHAVLFHSILHARGDATTAGPHQQRQQQQQQRLCFLTSQNRKFCESICRFSRSRARRGLDVLDAWRRRKSPAERHHVTRPLAAPSWGGPRLARQVLSLAERSASGLQGAHGAADRPLDRGATPPFWPDDDRRCRRSCCCCWTNDSRAMAGQLDHMPLSVEPSLRQSAPDDRQVPSSCSRHGSSLSMKLSTSVQHLPTAIANRQIMLIQAWRTKWNGSVVASHTRLISGDASTHACTHTHVSLGNYVTAARKWVTSDEMPPINKLLSWHRVSSKSYWWVLPAVIDCHVAVWAMCMTRGAVLIEMSFDDDTTERLLKSHGRTSRPRNNNNSCRAWSMFCIPRETIVFVI